MRNYKILQDGYILSIGKGAGGVELNESEYTDILNMIRNKPTAPDGYGYRLTDDLEWELYKLPTEDHEDEDATAEDYQAALAELGVSL